MRDYHRPGRSAVFGSNGMAATSHPLAASVALDILKEGGNAMDAAIAGAVLLGMCEPQMTGLGGDVFVLFTPPGTSDIRALNGSGRAPRALASERIRAAGHDIMPETGALPVTMPGAVDAFCRLSEDWGRLGLPQILAPAIRYADEGVPVAPRAAEDWSFTTHHLSGKARDFYLLDGNAPDPGALFRNPGMARVLRRIAEHGREGFYDGPVMEDMLSSLRAHGGCHTAEDFANTRATYTTPITGTYGDVELVEHPPNGAGATAILLLNILKAFDLRALDPIGATRAHIEAEATKLAYDARERIIADFDHVDRLDHMLSPDTARRLAALIDPDRALARAGPLADRIHRDTVYITVVDRDRMVVSLIYSIFRSFGAGLASDEYGILFHNRGSGFNLIPGHPNEAGGGKRPLHTILPAMLRQGGSVTMPFGVMGGAYQAAGHARFVTNTVDFGMHPQAAIDAPRSFAWQGGLRIERGYDPDVVRALGEMGHRVDVPVKPIGGAQAIRIHPSGVLEGASDPRKDGCALAY